MQEWQTTTAIITEVCGFVTIVAGTFLLHATKDMDASLHTISSSFRSSGPGKVTSGRSSGDISIQMQRLPLTSAGGGMSASPHQLNNSSSRKL